MRSTVLAFILASIVCWTNAADQVSLEVSSSTVSYHIPPDFSGFSYEVSGALAMTGRSPNPPKASFVQLLQNLRFTANSAGPNLRIGGNSADLSWWDPEGKPKPPHITYDISSVDLISVNNVAKAVNGSIVFDLNFRQANNPDWAINHVKAIEQYVGWDHVSGLEVGNECDLYKNNGIRQTNFTFDDYETEWYKYAQQIYATGAPKPRIQGATFCCRVKEFDQGLPEYMRKYRDLLASVSYHRYPTAHCGGHIVTLPELLSDSSTVSQGIILKPFATVANSLDLPFYVAEANSVACGGMPNVSDVFGSALWGVDFMYTIASINAGRINFHGGASAYYTPIAYPRDTPDVPDVRPLYYAMWVFARTTRDNARVLSTKIDTSNPLIKAWAVVTDKKEINVVVIHKDIATTESASVTISFPDTRVLAEGQLAFLKSATGPYAEHGVSFASQTFDGSHDGRPVGQESWSSVRPNNGHYNFTLPPATIAVLSLK